MLLKIGGLRAFIVLIFVLLFLVVLLVVAVNIFIILLPIVLLLVVAGYIFRAIRPAKKKKKDSPEYIDVKHRVK